MNKKNLGIIFSIIGGSIGLLGLASGGFFAMLLLMISYYFIIGFVITEFTDLSDNLLTWLFELFGMK